MIWAIAYSAANILPIASQLSLKMVHKFTLKIIFEGDFVPIPIVFTRFYVKTQNLMKLHTSEPWGTAKIFDMLYEFESGCWYIVLMSIITFTLNNFVVLFIHAKPIRSDDCWYLIEWIFLHVNLYSKFE